MNEQSAGLFFWHFSVFIRAHARADVLCHHYHWLTVTASPTVQCYTWQARNMMPLIRLQDCATAERASGAQPGHTPNCAHAIRHIRTLVPPATFVRYSHLPHREELSHSLCTATHRGKGRLANCHHKVSLLLTRSLCGILRLARELHTALYARGGVRMNPAHRDDK